MRQAAAAGRQATRTFGWLSWAKCTCNLQARRLITHHPPVGGTTFATASVRNRQPDVKTIGGPPLTPWVDPGSRGRVRPDDSSVLIWASHQMASATISGEAVGGTNLDGREQPTLGVSEATGVRVLRVQRDPPAESEASGGCRARAAGDILEFHVHDEGTTCSLCVQVLVGCFCLGSDTLTLREEDP